MSGTKINSISIQNVRGISSATFKFDVPEMLSNKVHLLVAPNGFGKSSFAAAFACLKPRSLKLPPELLHKDNEGNKPRIEISFSVGKEQKSVRAGEDSNEITRDFSISVINCRLKPHARSNAHFAAFAKPSASLIVEPVMLVERIPSKPTWTYSVQECRQAFGTNGKILPNLQPLLENEILLTRIISLPVLKRFTQKTVWKAIDPIIVAINDQKGNSEEIVDWLLSAKLQDLKSISELSTLADVFAYVEKFSETDRYLAAIQFARLYSDNKKGLEGYLTWKSFINGRKRAEDLLNSINSNSDWINIDIAPSKGGLEVSFPIASKMSNGQRDLLSFVAQLIKAEFELSGNRCILVIDEIFDYLDECNLLAAQYYISKFIAHFKNNNREIFPLILTHLDPEIFGHSVFRKKGDARKVHYLDEANDKSRDSGIVRMVKLRNQASLKPHLEKYFFHYHQENTDQTALFESNSLKTKWGKSHDFYRYIFSEYQKYSNGDSETDYVAACVAARIAIEKDVYDCLTPEQQETFIATHKTKCKLEYVEQSCGKPVPEAHYLLGLLYNEMLHPKDHIDYVSPIVSKMKNPAIRKMMAEIPIPQEFQATF
jgi:hypothetical protein